MTMPADAPTWLRDILTELARAQVRSEDRFATVESQLVALTTAQERTSEQLAALTAAQRQTSEQLARHDAQLATLVAAQEQMAALLARHDDRLGQLTGWAWESRVRDRAPSYLADVVDRVQVLTLPERDRLLDPAVRDGRLTRDEARAVRRADFVASGIDPEDGAPRLLVAEVSARVARRDVERAAARAALLNRLGTPVLAVVVGQRIDRDAQTAADAAGVRLIQPSA